MQRFVLAALAAGFMLSGGGVAAEAPSGSSARPAGAHSGYERRRQALTDRLNALVPVGKPVSCVNVTQIRETRALSDSALLFIANGKTLYLSRLDPPCSRLMSENRFSFQSSLPSYCSGQIINVFDDSTGVTLGSCALGPLQPVKDGPPPAR